MSETEDVESKVTVMTPELTMYNAPPEPRRDAEFDIVAPDRVAVNGAAPYE